MKRISLLILINLILSLSSCNSSKENKNDNSEIIRIMSYNIRTCRGGDNILNESKEYRYDLISDIINKVNPDFVAVQEIDSVTERSSGDFVLGELAERTSMYASFVPSIDYQGGKYGIGILSKDKPISYYKVKLPGREEARSLLIVEFENCIVACTHLSLTAEDRLSSASIIKDVTKNINKPFFLAGDMNSEKYSKEQNLLEESFQILNDYKQNTIPTYNPNRCIDFIYGLRNGYTYSVKAQKGLYKCKDASDHLPLYVDVLIHE